MGRTFPPESECCVSGTLCRLDQRGGPPAAGQADASAAVTVRSVSVCVCVCVCRLFNGVCRRTGPSRARVRVSVSVSVSVSCSTVRVGAQGRRVCVCVFVSVGLLTVCVGAHRAVGDSNPIRVTHALQTMAVLFKHIFRKKFANFGFDILNMCGGFERVPNLWLCLCAFFAALRLSFLHLFILSSL